MNTINPSNYIQIVFFTGAGMSAESGIRTYRGARGVWEKYNFEEYACEQAFKKNPEKCPQTSIIFEKITNEKL